MAIELPSKDEIDTIFSKLSDAVNAYTPNPDIKGATSRAEIREIAKALFLSTMTPGELGIQHCKEMGVLIAIRTAMKLELFKNLPEGGSISAEDLGKSAGVDPKLIERMFRVLVAVGFIGQEGEGRGNYKHTRFSREYTDPLKPNAGSLVQGMYDEYFKNTVRFDEYITSKFQPPYPEPSDILYNCFNWSNNMEGQNIWVTMGTRPERMAVFVNAFSGLDVMVPTVGDYFDFDSLASTGNDPNDRVEIVDVGGGNGRVLSDILNASPKLDPKKCVLQDTASVLAHAHGIAEKGIKLQEIDYFKNQPIKGAKAYYMRYILHDYADPRAIEILKIVASAMTQDSRVLLGEVVVPERVTEATIDGTVFDQILLCIGGKLRTARNFEEVLREAGMELVTIHHIEGTVGGLIEAKLK